VILNDKFVFIHLPKAGGSFIHNYLKNNFGEDHPIDQRCWHYPISYVKRKRPRFKDVFSFGAIRSPFSWYVSWWAFNTQRARRTKPIWSYKGIAVPEFEQSVQNIFNHKGTVPFPVDEGQNEIDFSAIHDLDIGLYSYFFYHMFCDWKQKLLLDKVIILEKITEQFPEMFEENIFPLSSKQVTHLGRCATAKVNSSTHEPWPSYWTDELLDLILHKDRLFFELFDEYRDEAHHLSVRKGYHRKAAILERNSA